MNLDYRFFKTTDKAINGHTFFNIPFYNDVIYVVEGNIEEAKNNYLNGERYTKKYLDICLITKESICDLKKINVNAFHFWQAIENNFFSELELKEKK